MQQFDDHLDSIRFLVVDDDGDIRGMLSDIFEIEGIRILSADSGFNALKLFIQEKPHIVLTDLNMPQMDGMALAQHLKEIDPNVRIVMMTAHSNEEKIIESMRLGIVNFIKKPFDILEIQSVIYQQIKEVREALSSKMLRKYLLDMNLDFCIPTNPAEIPVVLASIGRMLEHVCDARQWPLYETGLLELIQNAIEHGNLEIDYNQKSAALRANEFEQLVRKRMLFDAFADRTVAIKCSLKGFVFECTISDQGNGFDWRGIMHTIEAGHLERLNGRGLLIVKHNFDSVTYNEKGNQVRIVHNFAEQVDE